MDASSSTLLNSYLFANKPIYLAENSARSE